MVTTEFLEGFEDVPLGDDIVTGVTRSGIRFRPESPVSDSSASTEYSFQASSPTSVAFSDPNPYNWAMADHEWSSHKGMRRFSGVVGTIEVDDFIQEFDSWCDIQAMRSKDFTPFIAWKSLFQHLEGAPMDDYHDFRWKYTAEIDLWRLYWSPNYFSLTSAVHVETPSSPSDRGASPRFNPIAEFFQLM